MKKNIINSLYGLAVASLMLTACSSADDAVTQSPAAAIDDAAINFGAYLNRTTTRGGNTGELDADNLKDAANGFGVMAYYTDNQPYTPNNAVPNFMYNQQVTFTDPNWVYSPLKYWPNEVNDPQQSTSFDRLSFFAYAPYTEVDLTTGYAENTNYGIVGMTRSAETGNPKVRYTASFDPLERVDLCWAEPCLNLSKQAVNDKVLFSFRHALASLNVKIDAMVDETTSGANTLDPDTRIWVRSVTFEGLAMTGELNLNNGETTPEWNNLYSNGLLKSEPVTIYDGRRDGREGFAAMLNEKPVAINPILIQDAKYVLDDNDEHILTPDATKGVTNTAVNLFSSNDEDAPIFVIPTDEQLRVTVVYDVETYDPNLTSSFLSDNETNGSSIENTITKVVEGTSGALVLKAGKKYTINLHLGMTSAKFEVEDVKEWTNGDETDTDLPANN